MAPPTTKPRLLAIDPAALGATVAEAVSAHLGKLAFHLAPGADWRDAPHPVYAETNIAWSVADLVRYAQTGDEECEGAGHELLQTVIETVFARPLDRLLGHATIPAELWETANDADIDTPFGLVVVAAWARAKLADGESVTTRELAALGSVSVALVRTHAREGELEVVDAVVTPKEARRWLARRAVPGFG